MNVKFFQRILVFAILLLMLGGSMRAEEQFIWRTNRVEADIQSWPLATLLQKLSTAAGWEIYVEPGTQRKISSKFSDLPTDDALKRLLGNLSYALLPQTNGAPKFYVFSTSLSKATERISPEDLKAQKKTKHLIRNELVVTLAPDSAMTIEELAKSLGAKIAGRADALRTYRLEFPDEASADAAREKLKSNSSVASVDSNYLFEPPIPASTAQLNSSPAFNLKPTATGDRNHLIVGLIDTAVQRSGDNLDGFLMPQLSTDGSPYYSDELQHGTSMFQQMLQALASTEGGSSGVKILPVDVYGDRGKTTSYDVAYGIYMAINNGAMVINLSLGSSGDSQFLHRMIQEGSSQGVVFFAAAGNEPTTAPTYPAAYREVIAVTAGDRSGKVAGYANRGPFVDVIAPGSTLVTFGESTYLVGGTSVASAFASGVVAGGIEKSKKSPAEVAELLRKAFAFDPQKSQAR